MPKKLKKLDKKGVELTLNTIVIAVLVVLVLVVVIVFFIGGFKGLTDRIKATFFGTTAGTDEVLAVQSCQQFCEQAKLLPTDILKRDSAYCTTAFVIEGKTTKEEGAYLNMYVCSENHNAVRIGNKYNYRRAVVGLGVDCPEIKCQ